MNTVISRFNYTHITNFEVIIMYKLTFKKRVWIVKQFDNGISASKIALAQKIHRTTSGNT